MRSKATTSIVIASSIFGFETFSFPIESLLGCMIFHGLVWSAFLVIAGVMLAMRRRMRDRDAAALQTFGEDFMPLVLLFAISITGLMLVVSYEWMRGYGYEFLAIVHAAVGDRNAGLAAVWQVLSHFSAAGPTGRGLLQGRRHAASRPAARCGEAFASQMHVEDLIEVERQLGYQYETTGGPIEHYQRICPRCRRLLPALAQGRLWRAGG